MMSEREKLVFKTATLKPTENTQFEEGLKIGLKWGYKEAIDDLESEEFTKRCENGVDPVVYLKEKALARGHVR